MKKSLLLGSLLLGVASQSGAQLATENFNTGLPATWSTVNVDGKTISSSLNATIISGLATKGWMVWTRGTNDSAMLTASWFTPAGKADRWLISPSFMVTDAKTVLGWFDSEGISGATDSLQIWVSPTAGTTVASFTTKVYDGPTLYATDPTTGAYIYTQRGTSLGAYSGQTIRIAIRNNSTDQGVSLVDNVGTSVFPNALDASADAVSFPRLVDATSSSPVTVTVSNKGSNTITSVQVSYKVDAGTAVTQTFNGLSLPPYGSATLSFTTPVTGTAINGHTVTATILQVNGGADAVATNNTKTTNFITATGKSTRNALIEEFSSSTCVPCASFNATFDPLVVSNHADSAGSSFNIVKYQMNWPSPGTDVSYNNQGVARRTYYNVNAIPDHFTNGAAGGAGNQAEITAAKTPAAYLSISGLSYIIKKDSLIATATITPNFTSTTGNTYKVHMVGAEYHYSSAKPNNGTTTTQSEYYHIMRNMMGSGSGQAVTSWTAGTPQTFRWAHQWVVGSVAQMSNTYWNHPLGDGELVVFVQDEGDKAILNSAAAKATMATGVQALNETISQAGVYPNPATDHTSIAFKLESNATVTMQVIDALGRVVYTVADKKMNAGSQMFEIPTTSFAAGLYTIKLQADVATVMQRFSVVK